MNLTPQVKRKVYILSEFKKGINSTYMVNMYACRQNTHTQKIVK